MKSIFRMLLLVSWTACVGLCTAQSKHCIPIDESRKLHQDAFRSLSQDTIISELEGKVIILETEKRTTWNDFNNLLTIERQNVEDLKLISQTQEKVSESHREENKTLKKQVRRVKWQRNGAIILALLITGLSL